MRKDEFPIIDKYVGKSINEVLDKIKAEIRTLDDINPDYPMDRTIHINRNEVLEIIDKYRQKELSKALEQLNIAESEEGK